MRTERSIIPLAMSDEETVREICALKMQHWPHPMDAQMNWWAANSAPGDSLVTVRNDHRLVGFLRLRERQVFSGARALNALCATEVCVETAFQGQSVGRTLLRLAAGQVAEGPDTLGYLVCEDRQRGFYERCGWTAIGGAVEVLGEDGRKRSLNAISCLVVNPHGLPTTDLRIVGDVF